MKKKIASLALVLALCLSLLPTAAFAEGTSVDNWDGSADTSWYTSAPDASEYRISTAEQLAGLAQLVSTIRKTNFAKLSIIWKKTLIYPGMNGFLINLRVAAEPSLDTAFAVYLTDRIM